MLITQHEVQSMQNCTFAGMAAIALTGCGSGTTEARMKTTAADTVWCSSSAGPLAGPAGTVVDAGDVQECGAGGQCLYITAPGQGAGPAWTCVYASGTSSGH
jgi:hypothetical protein